MARNANAHLGPAERARYWGEVARFKAGLGHAPYRLSSRFAQFPVWARPRTSDLLVYYQIFVEREYACLDALTPPALVLDLGANVGYSSAYFLTRFADAAVVAVEPDPENFAVLERNLAPYGPRARAVPGGVWSHRTRLALETRPYGDGRAWSRQVAEDPAGPLEAYSIPDLLALTGHDRIGLLKVDVEGAECVLFGPGHEVWIDRVDALVVELHEGTTFGPCPEVFHAALAGRGFALSTSGELTVALRP